MSKGILLDTSYETSFLTSFALPEYELEHIEKNHSQYMRLTILMEYSGYANWREQARVNRANGETRLNLVFHDGIQRETTPKFLT